MLQAREFLTTSKHVAYRVVPDKDLVKKMKKEKKPANEIPKEKFELLNLETGKTTTMRDVQSFSFPRENGDWLAIKLKQPKEEGSAEESKSGKSEVFEVTEEGLKRPGKPSKKKKKPEVKKEKEPGKKESSSGNKDDKSNQKKNEKKKNDGTILIVKNLITGVEQRIPFVTDYRFDSAGKGLTFATSSKDDSEADGVWYFDLKKSVRNQILGWSGKLQESDFQ